MSAAEQVLLTPSMSETIGALNTAIGTILAAPDVSALSVPLAKAGTVFLQGSDGGPKPGSYASSLQAFGVPYATGKSAEALQAFASANFDASSSGTNGLNVVSIIDSGFGYLVVFAQETPSTGSSGITVYTSLGGESVADRTATTGFFTGGGPILPTSLPSPISPTVPVNLKLVPSTAFSLVLQLYFRSADDSAGNLDRPLRLFVYTQPPMQATDTPYASLGSQSMGAYVTPTTQPTFLNETLIMPVGPMRDNGNSIFCTTTYDNGTPPTLLYDTPATGSTRAGLELRTFVLGYWSQ